MPETQTKTIVEHLPCRLTESEILQAGKDAAREVHDLAQTEDEKKEAMASFQSRIKLHHRIIAKKSEMVRSGIEYRDVECEETRDYSLGMVRIVRTDTGEVVVSRPMSNSERQMRMEV